MIIQFPGWRPSRRGTTRMWRLGDIGLIQQFYGSGCYYGTWVTGRTGAMDSLDGCKAAVEKALDLRRSRKA